MVSLSDSRFHGGVVLALVLLNIALLIYVGWGIGSAPQGPPMEEKRGRKNPRKLGLFIQEELALRPDQVAQYNELITEHQMGARSKNKEIHQLKQDLFSSLNKPAAEIDSLSRKIGEAQQAKEMLTYQHFAALRAICDPDQQEKLDVVLKEVLHLMERRGPPMRNRDKGPPHPQPEGPRGQPH